MGANVTKPIPTVNGIKGSLTMASGTPIGYTFVSPDFSYSLKCAECKGEEPHTLDVHNALCGITTVKVVTVRDAAHLADILDGKPFEWDEVNNRPVGTEQDGQ
jgi:hypothetical protein